MHRLVAAINDGDRDAFLATLTPDAALTDDGNPRSLRSWIDREILSAHGHMNVEHVSSPDWDVLRPAAFSQIHDQPTRIHRVLSVRRMPSVRNISGVVTRCYGVPEPEGGECAG